MKIQYLGNSGWMLYDSINENVFIFDDISAGEYADSQLLDTTSQTLIFISHAHADHFDKQIFSRFEIRKDIHFILGSDIGAYLHGRENTKNTHFLSEGDSLEICGTKIKAYGSTDQGVSFELRCESTAGEKRIFHAGDLNDWHWKEDGNPEWTAAQGKLFSEILSTIAEKPSFDLAFFPVDPRMGKDYYRGALQFAEKFRPKYFVPMHFGESFDPPSDFFDKMPKQTKIISTDIKGSLLDVDFNR